MVGKTERSFRGGGKASDLGVPALHTHLGMCDTSIVSTLDDRAAPIFTPAYTHAHLECLIVDPEDVCVLIGIKVAKRAHAPGERVQGVGGL